MPLRPGSVEVLDDLVRPRPLLGWDDEIDVTTSESIQRVIGGATGIDMQLPKPVAPRHSGCLLLERAHCLPAIQARIDELGALATSRAPDSS